MHDYEVAIVFDPGLEIDLSKPEAKIQKILSDNGGKITKTDNWGKKKLAYKIGKHDHGVYVFYTAELPGETLAKIEATFNITDEIIRYLITRIDHKSVAKAGAIRADKAKKAAARGDSTDGSKDEE